MKKSIFIFTICFGQSLSGLFAQEVIANEEVIQEINKDIWLPFMDSYVRKDYELFNSLYTDDALRINSWSGIRLGREYKERIEASFSQSKSSKSQIYFAFFERYQYGDIAYENGIYRVEAEVDEDIQVSYAYFHVTLKKINGKWKIVEDYDSANPVGKAITSEDYQRGKILNN